jgi:hypothetical protein
MSLQKCQQALVTLYTNSFYPAWQNRVAWENVRFEPPQAMAWMAYFFVTVEERIGSLSDEGTDRVEGLVQIDLNTPLGIGESTSRQTIDELRACFRPQTIGYDGQPVTILSRSRAGGMTSEGFYKIPFNVRWRANISRST